MYNNMVGLEAEFFLRDKIGNLVLPKEHELPHDEFILLGEIRGLPGHTREDTTSNFLKEYYRILFLIQKKNLQMDIKDGWVKLDPMFYNSVVRKNELKHTPKCANIYNTDILNYSDSIIENGILLSHKISSGLHIHFHSTMTDTMKITQRKYEQVKLPLNIGAADTFLNLFADRGEEVTELKTQCHRITQPVIYHIVKQMDENIYPEFKILEHLRYRLPGFYEKKYDGRFEYRSLPFNEQILQNIPKIVDFSFSLLENL